MVYLVGWFHWIYGLLPFFRVYYLQQNFQWLVLFLSGIGVSNVDISSMVQYIERLATNISSHTATTVELVVPIAGEMVYVSVEVIYSIDYVTNNVYPVL